MFALFVRELLKQFSILLVRGNRHERVGSIHRLHQQVLRSKYLTSIDLNLILYENKSSMPPALKCCINTLQRLWHFDITDPATWDECGHVLVHLQVLVDNIVAMLNMPYQRPNVVATSNIPVFNIADDGDSLRQLSLLLTAGASYSMIVLSRFDVARNLLEAAITLQGIHSKALADHDSDWDARNLDDFLNGLKKRTKTGVNHVDGILADNVQFRLEKSNALHSLGKVLRIQGDFVPATTKLTKAMNLRMSSNCFTVADSLHELGIICIRDHDYETGSKYLSDSLLVKQLLQDADPAILGQLDTSISATLHQLSVIAIANGNYDEAEQLLGEALLLEGGTVGDITSTGMNSPNPSFSDLRGPASPSPSKQRRALDKEISRAATLQQLGRVSLRRGVLSEAEHRFRSAIAIYTRVYGESKALRHINVVGVRHQLGCCLSAMKRHAEASEQYSLALTSRELIHGSLEEGIEDSGPTTSLSETTGSGAVETLLELQSLGQSELECDRLDSSEMHMTRQRILCEKLLKSLDTGSVKLESECVGRLGDPQHRKKAESLVRHLLFALYTLKTIANRRQNRGKSKELSKEIHSLLAIYDHVLKRAQAHTSALEEAHEEPVSGPETRSVSDSCIHLTGECRLILRQLAKLFTARKKTKAAAVEGTEKESNHVVRPDEVITLVARLASLLSAIGINTNDTNASSGSSEYPLESNIMSTTQTAVESALAQLRVVQTMESDDTMDPLMKSIPHAVCSTVVARLFACSDEIRNRFAEIGIRLEDK
jgi:tetratricopeptide (TPR) repeat protein